MSRTHIGWMVGRVYTFRGVFIRYSRTPEGRNVALLRQVMVNGVNITSHIWIHRSKAMKQMELQEGETVEFEAEVKPYKHKKPNTKDDYTIERIRNMRRVGG